jgi:hypothetical protein
MCWRVFALAHSNRLLKNYLRCHCGVKNGLKMLIYFSKLRFCGHFCLALAASPTFFNSLLNAVTSKNNEAFKVRLQPRFYLFQQQPLSRLDYAKIFISRPIIDCRRRD